MSAIIDRIIGGIEEISDHFVRIKILSFRKADELIRRPDAISREFPPHGYVAAREDIFTHAPQYHDLVEFQDIHPYPNPFRDTYQINRKKQSRITGYPLFLAPSNISLSEDFFNPSILNELMGDGEFSSLYVRSNRFIFGPFRSQRGQVSPKSHKTVNKYTFNELEVYISGDRQYLLEPPAAFIRQLDCSTAAQLITWFKDKLTSLPSIQIDTALLKTVLSTAPPDSLDHIRYKRIVTEVDALSLVRQDILLLAEKSDKLGEIYRRTLQEMEEQFREEYIEKSNSEIKDLKRDYSANLQKLDSIKSACNKAQIQLNSLSAQISTLETNKDRLIDDIRIHAEVSSNSGNDKRLLTFDEQVFTSDGPPYAAVDEFISTLRTAFTASGFAQHLLAEKIMYQFKYKKCFLANSLPLILELVKVTYNCKLIIQQVEPEWTKFEYLYINGLQQIWESAHYHPDIIHLLVLEDINISSIECYARPVQDMIEGSRRSLPVNKSPWPANLWLIGLPFARPKNYEFGLPLFPETFRNWGFFPRVDAMDIDRQMGQSPDVAKKLLPATLYHHEKPFTPVLSEYFEP